MCRRWLGLTGADSGIATRTRYLGGHARFVSYYVNYFKYFFIYQGRLIDHLHNTPNFSLRDLEILVLDEADRMLDEFFASQMKEILVQTGTERQTLLFSATMSEKVRDLVAVSLKNPVKVSFNLFLIK